MNSASCTTLGGNHERRPGGAPGRGARLLCVGMAGEEVNTMKALWLALLFTVLCVGIAWAECYTNTFIGPNGRIMICTTCCWGNNCTTTCF